MNLRAARKFPFPGMYDYLKGQDLDNVLKSRYISLSTKVHKVKAMIFPVVMYGCERWTIKKKRLSTEELMPLNCGAGEDS